MGKITKTDPFKSMKSTGQFSRFFGFFKKKQTLADHVQKCITECNFISNAKADTTYKYYQNPRFIALKILQRYIIEIKYSVTTNDINSFKNISLDHAIFWWKRVKNTPFVRKFSCH